MSTVAKALSVISLVKGERVGMNNDGIDRGGSPARTVRVKLCDSSLKERGVGIEADLSAADCPPP
jgi:hypothetical protein